MSVTAIGNNLAYYYQLLQNQTQTQEYSDATSVNVGAAATLALSGIAATLANNVANSSTSNTGQCVERNSICINCGQCGKRNVVNALPDGSDGLKAVVELAAAAESSRIVVDYRMLDAINSYDQNSVFI